LSERVKRGATKMAMTSTWQGGGHTTRAEDRTKHRIVVGNDLGSNENARQVCGNPQNNGDVPQIKKEKKADGRLAVLGTTRAKEE